MTKNDIEALFDEWNGALQSGDPAHVTALYERDAILLPTISNQVRHNHAEISDYFSDFLALGPWGRIDEANIRRFDGLAINSGIYTFQFNDGSSVQARFSFVYRWNGSRWMIIEHHSSRLPECGQPG
ncbi:SgcJ/EcaC family oxidoreductase [Ferrimonas marina]|uniref:Calcium/calmodulin-dependent protein kinase II association-domain domain-containing protein n=1 Tax=Ferrimonas marina TaxID=299255 RepID=A0A1M5RHV3_9GAMM|nr:SgcJ/EcaC family oxidoreductase [Ferrimonas marina]SHH25373.1 conserved hypothetical protein [Ferrimonas marina]